MAMSREEMNRVLANAQEILVPYNIVEQRYPAALADIMEQLGNSQASNEAKNTPLSKYKWFFAYSQPPDPHTKNEQDFLRILSKNTECILMCRGMKWRGAVQIDELPQQVINRYEQRARLICSNHSHSHVQKEVQEDEPDRVEDEGDLNIGNLVRAIETLALSYPDGQRGYFAVAKTALLQARK